MKLTRIYARELFRSQRQRPGWDHFRQDLSFYSRWRRSLRPGATPLTDASPWMTFAAIDFLGSLLRPDSRVFEYGSGGSSLFLSQRAGEVVSVEHESAWAERVRECLARERRANVRLILAPPEPPPTSSVDPDPADPEGYGTADDQHRHCRFQRYASAIDDYACGYFQVIIIDGRARPSCFKHAVAKVGVGGWLVLDNAERPHYAWIHQQLNHGAWRKWLWSGPGPYNRYFWDTCFWQRTS